jgi:hypothetical protein
MTFRREDVVADLTPSEEGKFNNFLQRMKKLNVIRSSDHRGEYVFNLKMVRFYIWLKSVDETPGSPPRGPSTS